MPIFISVTLFVVLLPPSLVQWKTNQRQQRTRNHVLSKAFVVFRNALLIRLLKIRRQLTTAFALIGAHQLPHISVATISEISQYIFMKETTQKAAENSSTAHDGFALLGAHQLGTVQSSRQTYVILEPKLNWFPL
ncbi:hypothetical protein T265_03598 [Opisthorchis viverrini]|uniref:Secreted protein n=1 Tax=Opisthorchis viverrini TaxID=6198 RepID=A0A075A2V0_OPIVI|nr:hypothetical protein T265_03598 [Opisthorchis viverrini]KER29910.1 hypothetical protein T265_03598 [Opisthorchis viverrini]